MVKDRLNSERNVDEQGFKKRAACICVRSDDEAEVLLISSKGKDGRWKVPGGGVEPGEETSTAASREVYEEAGVKGQLGRSLGIFEDPDAKTRTEVYVMRVTEELEVWDESISMGRRRQWFPIGEALEQVALYRPLQRNYLQQLCLCKATKKKF